MANLNYQWISGTIPRNIMQQNMDMFHLLPGSLDAKDGFIHLLGKTEALYPMNGSMTYSIAAPYQFFYLYEGELSVSLNDITYTLSAGKAACGRCNNLTGSKNPLQIFPYVSKWSVLSSLRTNS